MGAYFAFQEQKMGAYFAEMSKKWLHILI